MPEQTMLTKPQAQCLLRNAAAIVAGYRDYGHRRCPTCRARNRQYSDAEFLGRTLLVAGAIAGTKGVLMDPDLADRDGRLRTLLVLRHNRGRAW